MCPQIEKHCCQEANKGIGVTLRLHPSNHVTFIGTFFQDFQEESSKLKSDGKRISQYDTDHQPSKFKILQII